jgi:hypothetical protein
MKNVVLCVAAVLFEAPMQPAIIPAAELTLGGVSVGQTAREVVAVMGTPTKQIDTGEGLRLDYEGFSAFVGVEDSDVGLWEMESRNPVICTPAGVCPGMTLAAVKDKYGEPLIANRPHGTFLEYGGDNTTCWLQLVMTQEVVQAVRVECQP